MSTDSVRRSPSVARSPASTPRQGNYTQRHDQLLVEKAERLFSQRWHEFIELRKVVHAGHARLDEIESRHHEENLRVTRLCQQLELKADRATREVKEHVQEHVPKVHDLDQQVKSLDRNVKVLEELQAEFKAELQRQSSQLVQVQEDDLDRAAELDQQVKSLDRNVKVLEELQAEFKAELQRQSSQLVQVQEDDLDRAAELEARLAHLQNNFTETSTKSAEFKAELQRQSSQLVQVQEDDLDRAAELEARLAHLQKNFTETSTKSQVVEKSQKEQTMRFANLEAKLAAMQEDVAKTAQFEAQLSVVRESNLATCTGRLEACESTQSRQQDGMLQLETKLSTLQAALSRYEAKALVAKEVGARTSEELSERIRITSEKLTHALERVHSDTMEAVAVSVAKGRESSEKLTHALERVHSDTMEAVAVSVAKGRESWTAELQLLQKSLVMDMQMCRDELRRGIQRSNEHQEQGAADARRQVCESNEASEAFSQQLASLHEELQQSSQDARQLVEDVAGRSLENNTKALSESNASFEERLNMCVADFQLRLSENGNQFHVLAKNTASLREECLSTSNHLKNITCNSSLVAQIAEEAAAQSANLQSEMKQHSNQLNDSLSKHSADLGGQVEQIQWKTEGQLASVQMDTSQLKLQLKGLEHTYQDHAGCLRIHLDEISTSAASQIGDLEDRLAGLRQESSEGFSTARLQAERAAQDWADSIKPLFAALAEPRSELRALRRTLADQESKLEARMGSLDEEAKRQGRSLVDHESRLEARIGSVVDDAYRQGHACTKIRHEIRDLSTAMVERLSDTSAEIANMQRFEREREVAHRSVCKTEAELEKQCERLFVVTDGLVSEQKVLANQIASHRDGLGQLRTEIQKYSAEGTTDRNHHPEGMACHRGSVIVESHEGSIGPAAISQTRGAQELAGPSLSRLDELCRKLGSGGLHGGGLI